MNIKGVLMYKAIPQGGVFIANNQKHVKVGNSHAINLATGDDFIPHIEEKFKLIGMMGANKLRSLDPIAFRGEPS